MWRHRAYTIETDDVGLTVAERKGRDAAPITRGGSPGPQVRERRPKARRPCLGCNRMMVTTCASRLCRFCLLQAADLQGGVDEMQLFGVLTESGRGATSG